MADSLGKATKKSQYESRVASLGNLGTEANQFEEPAIIMQQAAGDFISRVQQRITDSGMSVTGQSSDMRIEVISDTSLVVTAPASLIFQSYGVNGVNNNVGSPYGYTSKRPPIAPILAWIEARQIQSKNNPKYYSQAEFEALDDETKKNQMAWAISGAIYRDGIKPKNLIQPEIDELIEDMINGLAGNAMQDVLGKLIIQIPSDEKRGATRVGVPSSPNPNVP